MTPLRATSLILSAALCALPLAVSAGPPAKPAAAPYKAPRTAFGQPDLAGFWSNSTLTPFMRPAKLGDRAAYTEDEAGRLEAAEIASIKAADAPTDPDAPAEAGKLDPTKVRPEFAAAAGDTGGYNVGWLEPGQRLMRVGGEPRTSILTTANGRIPPRRKDAPSGGAFGRRGAFGRL